MSDRAYYANDVYQPSGRNPKGVRVTKADWLEIIEDAEPSPGPDEVVVRDFLVENGKHRKRKRLRDMTPEEVARRAADQADRDEDALWQGRIPSFEDQSADLGQLKKAMAHVLRRLHPQ